MQLRTGNTVLIQFDTLTDNAGNLLVSESGGELIFHKSTVFENPFAVDGRRVIVAGSGLNFRDDNGNTTTINNTSQSSDVNLELPSNSGAIEAS